MASRLRFTKFIPNTLANKSSRKSALESVSPVPNMTMPSSGVIQEQKGTLAACCIIPFRKTKATHADHHHQTG
jgi:hypothetical protein